MAIEFGLVGGAGWRAEFFLRVAQALPDRFRCTGAVVRNPAKAERFCQQWDVPVFADTAALLDHIVPSFVINSVQRDMIAGVTRALVERGMPVLAETPPATDLPEMIELWDAVQKADGKVQIAEQVWLRPHHQAQLAVTASGILGEISQAQISVAHGYHGIGLIRKFLRIGFDDVHIEARTFRSPIVAGAGRTGLPDQETIRESIQHLHWMDWGDRLGVFDFTGDQYFGAIRNERVLVRGPRGELSNERADFLIDYRTPLRARISRYEAGVDGSLKGQYLEGIQFRDQWVYRNPYAPARLFDDEIAIAHCMDGMQRYIETGADMYSLADGCQDHYLAMIAEEAADRREPVKSQRQPWAG